MNKEKAIDVLKRSQKIISPISPLYEAIGVALKQLDVSATDTNVGTKLSTNLAEVGTDMIFRQAAIDALRNYLLGKNVPCNGTLTCRLIENEVISKLPSAQPKKGRWIEKEAGTEDKEEGWETVIVCSRCDFPATTFYSKDGEERTQIRTHFCPNCGVKMKVTE